ncbi:hypothetical protein [Vibrio genomosp. F10]|uniref:hypothetical protein n=2 Tax=Vibrio genomosp. F10 TaxID=723171 RepID=UPI0002D4C5E2|nr:hypothetical protein [Vibrio genomosp. F10]OEF04185.1 hypothetical protein A1QI_11875 [Vibrio genomosp. F10 str. 9ZB36]
MKVIIAVLSAVLLHCTQAMAAAQTGFFIDAPITGIQYVTSSGIEGQTDQGAYQFSHGDVVDFYLGEGPSAFHLASVSAEKWVSPNSMTVTPTRTINMTRLLLAMSDFNKSDNILTVNQAKISQPAVQDFLGELNLIELDTLAQRYDIEIPSVGEAAAHLQSSYQYIKQSLSSDEIVYAPRDTELRDILIKTRDYQGHLCFYNVDEIDNPSYVGPVGSTTYKITNKGIFEYPDNGDRYGSKDGVIASCDVDLRAKRTEEEFHEVSSFEGWSGLFACALKGCTRTNLSGYVVEEYDSGNSYKYRANAMTFNPSTQIVLNKKQGLGQHEKVDGPNNAEFIWFTFASRDVTPLSFEGQWQEKQINKEGVSYRCLDIKQGQVWATPFSDSHCRARNSAGFKNASVEFGDMWWLQSSAKDLYFYHLNIPVAWKDSNQTQHYTTWEYLPVSDSLNNGILYRYQQILDEKDQSLRTSQVSELTKL